MAQGFQPHFAFVLSYPLFGNLSLNSLLVYFQCSFRGPARYSNDTRVKEASESLEDTKSPNTSKIRSHYVRKSLIFGSIILAQLNAVILSVALGLGSSHRKDISSSSAKASDSNALQIMEIFLLLVHDL